MPASVILRAAPYCRLSKDDEQIGESTSIETQRLMLARFCNDNHLAIVDYYVDDGFSGLTFKRPDFLRLMEDIEAGMIDVVITKDLSRLGRDYIMTGYLTDIYFSKAGIRYIAIDDGIDTLRESNDIAPFKNIMNDMYAKDISRKIKSAKRQRAYKGMHISAQAPYGYQANPDNRSKLMVDREAADVVRLIFAKASEHKTLSTIAAELAEMKIVIPAVYKAKNGETRFKAHLHKSPEEQYSWNTCTIAKILHDPVYIGHMVNHKYEVVSYKTKELRRVPVEERIVVENTHEAIIDPELFYQVQTILKSRSRIHRHEFDNWLQGKVFCADCQKPLSLMIRDLNGRKRAVLRCIHSYKHPDECTGYRVFDYDLLLQKVYEKIIAENPEPNAPPELTKSLIRHRVDRILIGKRQADGGQSVEITLLDKNKQNRNRLFPWEWY